jgi:hypothetical protein
VNRSKSLILAGVAIAVASGPLIAERARSARPAPVTAAGGKPERFSRDASAALFVGVQRFTHRQLTPVPYAADDAVDLAYLFARNRRVSLVRADRVVLALSGRPEKEESRRKLAELRKLGARVRSADRGDILSALRGQAALAGKNGIFIVSIATHGFVRRGDPYILGASSLAEEPETTLSMAMILDTAARSGAARSLVLVDACRDRIAPATRSVTRKTGTAAPLLDRISNAHGQAVLYAAAVGHYAYDDSLKHNGVFTEAVIDGLNCNAAMPGGFVTASTLAIHVENNVLKWIHANVDPSVQSATQSSIDGDARNMPLSQCWPPRANPAARGIMRATTHGSIVVAFKSDGVRAWQHDAGEHIVKAEVADLDADGSNEVVLFLRKRVSTLDADGKELWSVQEKMALRGASIADLFRKHTREVVTIWSGDHSSASRLSVFSAEGQRLSSFDFSGRLDHVAVGRQTPQHAPKIIVAGKSAGSDPTVLLFSPRKVSRGKPLWSGRLTPRHESIEAIEIADYDNNGKRDICIRTASGGMLVLDFKGKVISRRQKTGSGATLQFHLLHSRRTRP